ncbi:hypothetical protein OPV22_032964 [Ensete ventricosum]|uniref:Secreted protein n=1 Tax=Ensete ventricosum TaxID=4639 RepID=A0AAV8PZU5_ENSVE|nr:hypothetical protein OPV22_032964 [Ensete ventricosum]
MRIHRSIICPFVSRSICPLVLVVDVKVSWVPLSPSQRDKTIIFARSSRGGSFWEPAYPHFGTCFLQSACTVERKQYSKWI